MDLSLRIEETSGNRTKKAEVEILNASPAISSVMNGLFQFFGVKVTSTEEPAPKLGAETPKETADIKQLTPATTLSPSPERPKRLPIQRGEPFNVTIGERLGIAELPEDKPELTTATESVVGELKSLTGIIEEPEHYKTGIKYKPDGTPLYQCRYICKNLTCGKRGKKFIPEGSQYVTCHGCGTELKVRLIKPEEGFGAKDEWNNFYIADELNAPLD